jgi:hypothetical protein
MGTLGVMWISLSVQAAVVLVAPFPLLAATRPALVVISV